MNILYVLAAIVMLGVLIVFHECGHFLMARLTGIPVKQFSIGFGPKLLHWKSRKYETEFFVRLIPMGGYCAFYGEDDISGKEEKDPRSMNNFPVWKRMLTVVMGPVMNILLGFVVCVCLYAFIGTDQGGVYGYAVIRSVSVGSPAEQAGIQVEDVILKVNGEDAAGLTDDQTNLKVTQLLDQCLAEDPVWHLTLERGQSIVETDVMPHYSEADDCYLMGVQLMNTYQPNYRPTSFAEAVDRSYRYCTETVGSMTVGIVQIFTGGVGLEELGGVVGIVTLVAEETQKSGLFMYLGMMVMISINLGLCNMIPFPALDGGRFLFLIIEAIRRKPNNRKIEAIVNVVGFVFLIILMVLITRQDILRLMQ